MMSILSNIQVCQRARLHSQQTRLKWVKRLGVLWYVVGRHILVLLQSTVKKKYHENLRGVRAKD